MSAKKFMTPITVIAAGSLAIAACGSSSKDSANNSDDNGTASAVPTCVALGDLYALTSNEAEGVANWSEAQDLATELGSTTELPDAEFTLYGPGEESGTFGSYVELALQKIGVDERGLEKDAVTTRPDYESSADDNVIVEGVAGTDNSLGWVGYAFADENKNRLRLLEVDGGSGCIAPTPATISDGSYPLSRPLFIYVNKEKAASNPALAAFVSTYMSEEGPKAVKDADYINVDDSVFQESVSQWEALGIEAASDTSGSVVVTGSSTVEPISKIVAEKFSEKNPDAAIDVSGPGTSDGLKQFCNGEADVADASRAMKDEEKTLCSDGGVEYLELQIGIDGISIITKK